MFNRTAIKKRAKGIFKNNAGPLIVAFALAVLLPMLLSGGTSGTTSIPYTTYSYSHASSDGSAFFAYDIMELPTNYLLIPFATGALITISLVALAISLGISIYTIVATGAFQRMCLKAYDGVDVQVKDLVEVKGYWLKLLGLYLWMTFRIFLWSLLFVIPGIIAAYRYALAPYLMFEDPSKGINRVIGESAVLMRGYKGDLFILDLSFIGWWLLVGVTFGIAILFVGPYYEVARAGAYRSIRYLNTSRQPQTSVPGIASYAPTTNVDASASMPDASPPVTVMESGEIDPVIIEIIEE